MAAKFYWKKKKKLLNWNHKRKRKRRKRRAGSTSPWRYAQHPAAAHWHLWPCLTSLSWRQSPPLLSRTAVRRRGGSFWSSLSIRHRAHPFLSFLGLPPPAFCPGVPLPSIHLPPPSLTWNDITVSLLTGFQSSSLWEDWKIKRKKQLILIASSYRMHLTGPGFAAIASF